MKRVAILGAGGYGISLSKLLSDQGVTVTLWSALAPEIDILRRTGCNEKLLPGVSLPPCVRLTTDLREAVSAELAPLLPGDTIVVCGSKGIDFESGATMTELVERWLPDNPVVALSGPSHAEEVARGVPTSVVAASRNRRAVEVVQDLMNSSSYRVYLSDDIKGVELGGALKNIIALAAGISDGIGLGDNSKAALMTRGLAEIARLGVALGAREETFAGLSGLGDMIVTCTSVHSRNQRAGVLIGQGKTPEEALKEVGMTVEGYYATASARRLAERHRVTMPSTQELYLILYEGKPPEEAGENHRT